MRHDRCLIGLHPPAKSRPSRPAQEAEQQADTFEKWYLARRRQIDPDIWRIWKGGITATLAKPAFQQAWSIIKSDSKLDPEFEGFVDQCIHYPSSRLAA